MNRPTRAECDFECLVDVPSKEGVSYITLLENYIDHLEGKQPQEEPKTEEVWWKEGGPWSDKCETGASDPEYCDCEYCWKHKNPGDDEE